LCLGFHLRDNFRFPYAAIGFSDFWRRWHISLSTFLRDYLYIPLGGNRAGAVRALVNLVIVMFIGGLWHGAAWTFVAWGLLHGAYLVIERLLRYFIGEPAWTNHFAVRLLVGIVTYVAVLIAWVYFRAADFSTASRLIGGMFGRHPHGDALLTTREIWQVVLVTRGILIAHWSLRETTLETAVSRLPRWAVTSAWFFMAAALILAQGSSNAFIYFQF
jgi:alginate O-acetyltransferase complex protein AlgI